MGLDTTHDCYHGGYSSFNLLRKEIAKAAGIPLKFMEGYYRESPWLGTDQEYFPLKWDILRDEPLIALLNHSDCDGDIALEDCLPLAERLEELAPLIPDDRPAPPFNTWRTLTLQFARGLRLADSCGENVEFH